MHKLNGHLTFSPTDLAQFMESPFVSWMNRFALECSDQAPEPDPANALMQSLQQKGIEHEQQLIKQFQQQNLSLICISEKPASDQAMHTQEAMRLGIDIIVQGVLNSDPFSGTCDFLVKVPGTSDFGPFQYEVWESKLSTSQKPAFVIQLCAYTEMLEHIQGVRPENMILALGENNIIKLQTQNYLAYYNAIKSSFIQYHQSFDPESHPDPFISKNHDKWSQYVDQYYKKTDHLAQIANITRSQVKKLQMAGIQTMAELVKTDPGALSLKIKLNPEISKKLYHQARIQKETEKHTHNGENHQPCFEIIPPLSGTRQGLALLPPHSNRDVFFDIEGFPLEKNGLEYLWGCTYFDDKGNRQFKDFWAHNHAEEKTAFEAFIKWVYQRWQLDPQMHIYHYAPYEIVACRKLMGQYGVCEHEVDQLLRHQVFVDLYAIVKKGILLGEPRYSIKNVEHLYRAQRDTAVGNGGDSVAVYEQWRENNALGLEGDSWETSILLKHLRDYNIDDCNSTQELTEWLRQQQQLHDISYIPHVQDSQPDLIEKIDDQPQSSLALLRDTLLERAKSEKMTKPQQAAITEHLAWTLEFHKRELKPVYWKRFERLAQNHHELFDDLDCLAMCTRTEKPAYKPGPRARNLVYEYQFDPAQEFKGSCESYFLLGDTQNGKSVKVKYVQAASDLKQGLIGIQSSQELPAFLSLIPDDVVNTNIIEQALEKRIQAYADGTLTHDAILDFLARIRPKFKTLSKNQDTSAPIVSSHNPDTRLGEIIDAVKDLDRSYLTIQGPPGAGKSYTGKHIIAALIAQGARVGITSNSHKAINHLLKSTALHCQKNGIPGTFYCTKGEDEKLEECQVLVIKNNALINHIEPGCVIGTTAWGFARDDMTNQLDYLFVDEAGQVSVANLIAMSQATTNIILMGDQMQLGQPLQGSHPEESGLSVLDYLLHEQPTLPENIGIFLETTYRMHPNINEWISRFIYDGKLDAAPENKKRIIDIPINYQQTYPQGLLCKTAGIIPIFVEHEGNTQASEEEVKIIYTLAHQLLGRTFYTSYPQIPTRHIGWQDMLFVAPYNHQVTKLQQALGPQAQVGSVDKFQGQEAPVVFLSMCASDGNETPRGIDFLFDRHRLNVAISRAQTLAIVVCSPSLKTTSITQISQMRDISLFNELVAVK